MSVPESNHHGDEQRVGDALGWDAFLSYAREDELAFAHPVYLALTGLGVRIWFDQERLLLGMQIKDRIEHGVAASRFGIALLTPQYFRETKQESTLYELELFLSREERDGQRFLLPIICQHVDFAKIDRKYAVLKDRVFANWAKGPQVVLDAILHSVNPPPAPGAPRMISLPIPLPDSQQDTMVIANAYERIGQYKEAAQVCLRFLQSHPDDANTLKRYLTLTQSTYDRHEIGVATIVALDWFKNHPNDVGVRDKFLRFVCDVNMSIIPAVIQDLYTWLSGTKATNPNIRAAFLSLVMRHGPTKDLMLDVAYDLGRRWLQEADVGFVRTAWFLLGTRQGSAELAAQAFEETADWLARNPEPNVLAAYLGEVARLDVRSQYERAFSLAETWFQGNPHDTFVMPVFLDFCELVSMRTENRDLFGQAVARVTEWLDNRIPSHQKDARIREKYISTIRRIGSEAQRQDAMERIKRWLILWCGRRSTDTSKSQRPVLTKATNVWVSYLGLVADAGTDDDVQYEIEDVLDWLATNPERGVNLRARLLGLVEQRSGSASICFSEYPVWLRNHSNMPESTEVRHRFIRFVTRCGSRGEMEEVRHDTQIWLQGQRRDAKVRKALQILSLRLK